MDPGHLLFKDNRNPKGKFATATLDATKSFHFVAGRRLSQ